MKKMTILILLMAGPWVSGFTQDLTTEVSMAEKATVVDSVATMLEREYVYPETGQAMSLFIRKNLNEGTYDSITDPRVFAYQLAMDIQSVSKDRHLAVFYDPERIRYRLEAMSDPEGEARFREIREKELRAMNFGFKKVEILKGNIGYIRFDQFADPSFANAGQTAISALQFVSNSKAVIFDLRNNGGGNPGMIQLISAYLFEESEHLNTFYWRPTEAHNQFWSLPFVPGDKITDKPVYVLTSDRTFSAAEEFTYNLKNMKRATIVGDTTGGGAHPVENNIINDHFSMNIAKGKAINPVTGTNWEGTGVYPHVAVSSDQAMTYAHLMALDSLLQDESLPEPERNIMEWQIPLLKAMLDPPVIEENTAESYVGDYGPRHIFKKNGDLFYHRDDRPVYKMIPISEDTFMFEEIDYFRLKILKEDNRIIGVRGLYDNGRTDDSPRDK